MVYDNTTKKVFEDAVNLAKDEKHEYVTPEHILYTSLKSEDGRSMIENLGGNIEAIKNELLKFMNDNIQKIEEGDPIQSVGISVLIQNTALHILNSGRNVIKIGDIIAGLYELNESFATYILKKNGINRIDILKYISHGITINNQSENNSQGTEQQQDSTTSQNPMDFIKAFTVDLVEKANEGKIDPLIGREEDLKRTIQILSRRLKNNPVHVGDPGVGKTAITEGLANLIFQDKVPKILRGSRIYSIDMGSLLAGTKYRGDFEERMKKLLNELEKLDKAIVYIDEIHTVVGAGEVSGGSMNASNILKPYLSSGKLRFIGSTTYEEYKKFLEKDKPLSRRFQKVEINEPSIEESVLILQGLQKKYEEHHNVKYTKTSLRLAVELSAKYINDRNLPDKAIDVIDEAGAFARMNAEDDQGTIKIDVSDIERVVSSIAKVPKQSVSSDETTKLKDLDVQLKAQIFGQDKAIESVVQAIKRSRAGFNDVNKPVASLLFVGPTGVGKTELSRQISSTFGIPLIRFDMSEYQEKHTVARLIGAPPGYVGYEEGGLLTDAIRKTPYCVLLLDEIEKAHPDVFNVLLQIMDYATLTDNNGKKADFRNVILVMTSNAGAREIGKALIGFEQRNVDNTAITKEVEKVFLPEFRNRLDEIVVFNHINDDMALQIAKKAIAEFEKKLTPKNIKLSVTDNCYKWLAEKGLSSTYGAREILRVVQDKIKTRFVDEVLFGNLSKGGSATIDIVDGEIVITSLKKK